MISSGPQQVSVTNILTLISWIVSVSVGSHLDDDTQNLEQTHLHRCTVTWVCAWYLHKPNLIATNMKIRFIIWSGADYVSSNAKPEKDVTAHQMEGYWDDC